MKKSILIASALTFPILSSTFAQRPAPVAPSPAKPAPSTDTHTSSSSSSSNNAQYGKDIPVFDAQTESVSFMGKTHSLADNRMADQFTSYLVQTQAKIEEAAKYRKTLREILDTLDRGTKGTAQQKIKKAYDMLGSAKNYPQDSGISESLQNSLAIARQSVIGREQSDREILEAKKNYAAIIKRMEFDEGRSRLDGGRKLSSGSDQANTQNLTNKTGAAASENERARLELLALMKTKDIGGTMSKRLGKWQYQAMLMQLFMQRRFEHCVIGCRFYNLIFNEGESQLKIEKGSELQKFFSDNLGVNPTVAGLDSISNEMIGKSKATADSVRNHIKRKQIDSATRRMIEAFVIGEHLTPIHTFDPDMRNAMHQYIMDSKNLKDSIEVKNWQEAEIYTNKLRSQAEDFRHIKAITAITGFKNASDLKVAEYKISMANEDVPAANKAMEQALEYWPTNPSITQAKLDIMGLIAEEGGKLKTLKNKKTEFDSIVRTKDFRNVSVKDAGTYQEYFKGAMMDKKLPEAEQDQYRKLYNEATVLYDGLEAIETAIRTAQGLADRSQHYEAWEAVKLELDKDHLDKARLHEALNQFSSRASKFQDLFIEATELEENKNYGSALSCYLKAQSLFAKSKLAEDGVNRLLAEIQ